MTDSMCRHGRDLSKPCSVCPEGTPGAEAVDVRAVATFEPKKFHVSVYGYVEVQADDWMSAYEAAAELVEAGDAQLPKGLMLSASLEVEECSPPEEP